MEEEQRTGYCHNKHCELFNQCQGDNGLEPTERFSCIVCKKTIKKNKLETMKICKKCNKFDPMSNEEWQIIQDKKLSACRCGIILTVRI